MKKQILTLALAGMMTVPAAAADTPMFGPGQPISTTTTPTLQNPVPQAGYSATGYTIPEITLSTGEPLGINEIENLVRNHNLQVLMMDQQLKSMKDMDVSEASDALNTQANQLTQLATQLQNMLPQFQENPAMTGLITANCTILNMQAATLKSQATSTADQLDEQIDELEDQFYDAENQLVFAAESTFLAIKTMEGSYDDLIRQRTTLTATLIEMQKRYDLGQISALQLQETKNGLVQLESGIATLAMNIENTKGDLNLLLGRDGKFSYTLIPLPIITDAQIAQINYDKDVGEVLRHSSEVRNAQEAIYDAEDQDSRYAENAAELTYDNTVKTVKQNFLKLCRAVTDKQQLVQAAQSDFTLAQQTFQSQQVKFQNGQISQNTYDAAKATLDTAANAVTTAQNNLYTAYMKYEWALKGVVSSS